MATLRTTWRHALAWRMERHLLDPIGHLPVEGVVERLCGVQAQVASSAELAIRLRQATSQAGEVAAALADGRLIRTWAMRGTLHLLTPVEGAAFLSLIAAARSWERPVWVRYFGLTPEMMVPLREAVGEILADGSTLTREELTAAIGARPDLEHLADGLRSGWGTLLKPLAWQGDLCFGPSRGTRVTFMRPGAASTRWAGVPDPEIAAPLAIAAYFGAHGPATAESFGNWLAGGWFGKRQLRPLFAAMGDRLVEVEVDGERALILAEHVDELAAAQPTSAVRLLAGFDQYVLGPGTADPHVLAQVHRRDVSRQSGWIAPVVVSGGVVAGTWELDSGTVRVAWFSDAGRPARKALAAEVDRLGSIVGRPLDLAVGLAASSGVPG